MVIWAKRLLM